METTFGTWSSLAGVGSSRQVRIWAVALARQHPANCVHQLVGVLVSAARILQAMAHVVVHQAERDLVERRADGVDLSHDVDAAALVLDHPRDAAHLALDTREPLEQVVLRG